MGKSGPLAVRGDGDAYISLDGLGQRDGGVEVKFRRDLDATRLTGYVFDYGAFALGATGWWSSSGAFNLEYLNSSGKQTYALPQLDTAGWHTVKCLMATDGLRSYLSLVVDGVTLVDPADKIPVVNTLSSDEVQGALFMKKSDSAFIGEIAYARILAPDEARTLLHLVPHVDGEGVVGMLDTVGGVFHTSANSHPFEAVY